MSLDLNRLIESFISEFIRQWMTSKRYDKHDSKLTDCVSLVFDELFKENKANKSKWKKDSTHMEKLLAIIRDDNETNHPLYTKIKNSDTWKHFQKERGVEKTKIQRDAKGRKIYTRTPWMRRRYSAIREEFIYNLVVDSPLVVKNKRAFAEHQRELRALPHQTHQTHHTRRSDLEGLKDPRNRRLANITDAVIGTKRDRKKLKQWLIDNNIVAVEMRSLKWLTHMGSVAMGNNLKARFMALLDILVGTKVFAANFGENSDIADCEPLECLKEHIQNDHGPIRRYFLSEVIIPRSVRIDSLFPKILLQAVKEERKHKRGVWIEHVHDDDAWDAVAKSNAQMGEAFVTQEIAKTHVLSK